MVRIAAGLFVVLLAALCAWVPMQPDTIERWYALGVYPAIQARLTPVTNMIPFALLDMLVVSALLFVVVCAFRAVRSMRRNGSARPLAGLAWTFLTATSLLYLLFLGLWGFNYRRVPVSQHLELSPMPPSAASVAALGARAVVQLNRLHANAHQIGWTEAEWQDAKLRGAFHATLQLLSEAPEPRVGRIKSSLLGTYFRWSSVDGMINPFGLEVLANPDLLPWERPFVAAHEWSHLAGYANEAEANFVGWLTCVRGSVPVQYSGWLFLYWQIAGQVDAADRAVLADMLDAGPRADLQAITDRLRRGEFPFLRNVSWRVYDRYLKANRVNEGVRSYDEVLTLILRAGFDDGWTPRIRGRHR
jgi:Protein of unknown function (DUF3810)